MHAEISCADPKGWGGGGRAGVRTPPPPENHKIMGFLSNTGPLQNHKAIKPAIIDTPAQRHLHMAFRRRADDEPLIMVFGSYIPSSTKKATIKNIKNAVEIGAPQTKLSGSAHGWDLSFDLILYLYMQVIKALAGQLGVHICCSNM